MNSHMLSKLAIFVAAFMINGFELAAVNYLFSGEMQQRSDWVSLVQGGGAGTAVYHYDSVGVRRY
jgi:hypothetical protein